MLGLYEADKRRKLLAHTSKPDGAILREKKGLRRIGAPRLSFNRLLRFVGQFNNGARVAHFVGWRAVVIKAVAPDIGGDVNSGEIRIEAGYAVAVGGMEVGAAVALGFKFIGVQAHSVYGAVLKGGNEQVVAPALDWACLRVVNEA